MLVDRRESQSRWREPTVDRLRALLAELLPGQANKDITTGQAERMLASARPPQVAGKTRRRIAAEELAGTSWSRDRSYEPSWYAY